MIRIKIELLFRTNVWGDEMKKYKVVDKNRFYTFLTFLFLFAVMAVYFLFSKNTVHSSVQEIQYYQVEVAKGDNLWKLASKHMPGDGNMQKLVYELKKFNGLENSYIYPGDLIKIPISY